MHKTVFARWAATRRNRQLISRILPALCALLLLIGLGGTLLVKNALSQDTDVQQRSRTFIARTFDQVRNELARNTINYSKWGEAYRNLHLTVDRNWADDQRNVGDIPYDLYGYNGALVIDPQDRTVYAVIDGQAANVQAGDWLEGDVAGLVAAAREPSQENFSVVRAFRVGGVPALAAAGTITPGWDPSIQRTTGPASVLLFVTVLDAGKLTHLSETYGLPILTPSTAPLPGQESMPLLDSGIQMNWNPPQPGLALLKQTLPLFGAGVLALAIVLTLLLRHALVSARQLDAQFDAVRASEAELRSSERRFRDIAEASSDWLWEVDAQGRLTYLSERFTQVTQARREDWLGQPLADLLQSQGLSLHRWLQAQARPGNGERDALLCHYHDSTGRRRICTVTARAIRGEDGEGTVGHRGTATDITDEVEAQAEVRHLSLHDALTGLPNRRRLHQFLDQHLADPQPDPNLDPESVPVVRPAPLTLLSLDLDRFKPVNDAFGHAAGDRVLQDVARRLRPHAGPEGLVARLGGDEFVLALPGIEDMQQITRICTVLVDDLCRPFALGPQQVYIGTSIGITLAPTHASTTEELLRLGDIALYQAKAAGRNTWRVYTAAMNTQLVERRHLEDDLRRALNEGQLRLHYQPRYATADGTLRSCEALVRWQHPQRGLLPPDLFIPLAEDSGLIEPLGRWVLETACREAARWPDDIGVSVNLSPGQFGKHRDIPGDVARALHASGLPAHRLELEITERVLLAHDQAALATLQALKDLGVRLSLDDFGTGFSSLAYLRRYPLDGIKIDRSFIAELASSGNDRAIVQALGDLGRSLGITVTAEGVETPEQLACLRLHPCDEVQGFHFSRPLPPQALAELFARARLPGNRKPAG